MLIHVNSLGITCIEPEKGHLIRKKKSGQTFKKVFLGKQDHVENYEQVVDVNYIHKEEEIDNIQLDENLEIAKKELIKLSKEKLSDHLENNPLFSTVKYEDGRYYNVTLEKQNLLLSNIVTYQLSEQSGLRFSPIWNSVGEMSEPWTLNEMLRLSLEIKDYVNPLVQLQQAIEIKIKECKSIEELKEINMDFNLE